MFIIEVYRFHMQLIAVYTVYNSHNTQKHVFYRFYIRGDLTCKQMFKVCNCLSIKNNLTIHIVYEVYGISCLRHKYEDSGLCVCVYMCMFISVRPRYKGLKCVTPHWLSWMFHSAVVIKYVLYNSSFQRHSLNPWEFRVN